jgi:NAD+ kinase
MRVALFGRSLSDSGSSAFAVLLQELSDRKATVWMVESLARMLSGFIPSSLQVQLYTLEDSLAGLDAMITIGGDGTLLEALTHIRDSDVPVVGINTGRLGFLTAFPVGEIPLAVQLIAEGKAHYEARTLLGLETAGNPFAKFPVALNEVTIHKRDTSSMITLEVTRNGKELNTYWADGLIISTATGSTGYSLSCGGPVLLPELANLVITPIAPHNLNVRPLVVSEDDELCIRAEARGNAKIMISMDSRSAPVPGGQQLIVKKAPYRVRLMKREHPDFLDTLRNKLMWGNDKRKEK